ncbi:MAG: carbohydrate binding family 9 domain-containing protein [Bacteroidota bacterium]|nr:carbohydrate binding family 9 domain-containing protein [Bacteroidota bacterium]
MYRFFLICWLTGLAGLTHAQTPDATTTAATQLNLAKPAPKRQLQAVRIATAAPKMDGVLDEAVWQTAPIATDFYELEPTPGPREKHKTEVRVLYDDAALYIGAVMHDVSPDSILHQLSERDDFGNTDWFGIFLDTYNDHLNGYEFLVSSGGVQVDARFSPTNGEDKNWNSVWESRTVMRGTDWVAELRIPFSAIRFSAAAEQVWGINFGRQRRSSRQKFFWNEVRPQVDGFVNQWGELTGLRNLKPPLRLSLTPYVSTYVNHYPYNVAGQRNASTSFNGGADVKWGINESFTLDATLVPDFGQVQSDNQVLNLSPFEVQYNENRGFFTEGTELFNKGGLFYSRRVGAQPIGFNDVGGQLRAGSVGIDGKRRAGEYVVQNPGITRLVNATKVSGRTASGLGVGIFNAVSNNVYATVQDSTSGTRRDVLTQPFTNYNIVVLDQSLKNNSYVSLVNTNVTRVGSTYDANVTGGLFRFANQANSYALDGRVVYSRRRGQGFGTTEEINDQNGYKYYLNFGKISGKFTWNVDHGIESHTYNPNDLGLLFANNSISQSANVGYNIYQPFWKLNRLNSYAGINYSLLEQPRLYQDAGVYAGVNTTLNKSFLSLRLNVEASPTTHDYFDPRRAPLGRYYVRKPGNFGLNGYFSSDYRKKFAWDLGYGARFFAADGDRTGRYAYSVSLGPRYRVNDKLSFVYSLGLNQAIKQIGFAGELKPSDPLDAPTAQHFGGVLADGRTVNPLLGRRDVATITNTATATYTFTNRMSFNIRLRHYVSNVHYRDFAQLRPDGLETPEPAYQRNRDNTFNAFNIDAVYSWWFAPGSQVSIVWKNASASFFQANQATPLYFDNLSNTINTPHNNNVSIKVLYYLDYLALRPRRG